MARRIESWKYAKSSNTCIPICCFLHKINMKSLKLVAFAHQSKLVIREDPISVTWFLDTCCCIDAMSRHWTCHAISALLHFTDIISWLAGIDCGYPVPDLSHDVQRPISDKRPLRYGACAEQRQQTRASWRQARVRGLRQEVYGETPPEASFVDCPWCWWRQDFQVWRLLICIEAQT